MDEDSHKRNTDCVYFLASPLTCKKGIECEYRHSDIARLNPRDCWYWLAGNCLNPTCAFRHPPLEGYTKGLSESDASHSQSALPVKKKNVPCYFFFNGICNKGDRCYFMHKPDDSAPALKSTKTAVSSDAQFSEKKESLGSDTGSAPSKRKTNLSQTAAKGGVGALQSKSAQDLLKLDVNNAVEQCASPHISASDCKGVAAHSSASLPPGEGFVQHWSPACADQSSDEQVDGYIERDERLESSPGFDVLVDGSSENMGYEGEQEYLLNLDGDQGELNTSFLGYDYEDHVEYDPAYSDAGNLYDQEILDSYEHLDSERSCDYVRKVPGCRERILDRIFSRKRKLLPINLVSDNRCGMDLRDHLRKRRVPDGHSSNNSSRRHGSSRVIGRSRGRPHHNGTRRLRGRLTTEVENNFGKLHSENGTLLNDIYRDARLEHHDISTSRLHFREKKQGKHWSHSSDIAMHSAPKKRRVTEEISVFSGPKSLAQIREEKRNARENGDSVEKIGLHCRYQTEDFQGPKSLSDILKDKKRLGSLVERNNASC